MSDFNGYKILDNGIAEGVKADKIDVQHLCEQASIWGFNEVVIPDALGDSVLTRRLARQFGTAFGEDGPPSHLRYMAVVQGFRGDPDTYWETLISHLKLPYVSTIGLPRIMVRQGDERIQFLRRMRSYGINIPVHFLGASWWVKEITHLSTNYPGISIRGIDTSAPLTAALAGISIAEGRYVDRRDNFFEDEGTGKEDLIDDNCRTYLEWAGYKHVITPDGSSTLTPGS